MADEFLKAMGEAVIAGKPFLWGANLKGHCVFCDDTEEVGKLWPYVGGGLCHARCAQADMELQERKREAYGYDY